LGAPTSLNLNHAQFIVRSTIGAGYGISHELLLDLRARIARVRLGVQNP
jgi:hypothetical protein